MDSFFFRVEHDLLRSPSFQELRGSAIKVYLVIGLHSDFGTGWAYPSIRTIARQAGVSRQTVLEAITDLTRLGIVATSKSKGRSTAYRILPQPPARTGGRKPGGSKKLQGVELSVPEIFQVHEEAVLFSLDEAPDSGLGTGPIQAQRLGQVGRVAGPKGDTETSNDNMPLAIPGTPFEIQSDGRLAAANLLDILKSQGLPPAVARKLLETHDADAVIRVLLNALFLQSQGKLQNAPGYIRSGIEAGYELLPQLAQRLEKQRKDHFSALDQAEARRKRIREQAEKAAEEAAIQTALEALEPAELSRLTEAALEALPDALTRRNPTLSNAFVRGKVYELAVGGFPRES